MANGEKGKNTGQMREAVSAPFAEPMNNVPPPITGISGTHNDIGEKSGFETTGYIYKGDTPYGENAKLNMMPPGMEIDNQEFSRIYPMKMTKVVEESYPGDGWTPKPGNSVG